MPLRVNDNRFVGTAGLNARAGWQHFQPFSWDPRTFGER